MATRTSQSTRAGVQFCRAVYDYCDAAIKQATRAARGTAESAAAVADDATAMAADARDATLTAARRAAARAVALVASRRLRADERRAAAMLRDARGSVVLPPAAGQAIPLHASAAMPVPAIPTAVRAAAACGSAAVAHVLRCVQVAPATGDVSHLPVGVIVPMQLAPVQRVTCASAVANPDVVPALDGAELAAASAAGGAGVSVGACAGGGTPGGSHDPLAGLQRDAVVGGMSTPGHLALRQPYFLHRVERDSPRKRDHGSATRDARGHARVPDELARTQVGGNVRPRVSDAAACERVVRARTLQWTCYERGAR